MTYKIRELDDDNEVIDVDVMLRINIGFYRNKYGYCEQAIHRKGLGTYYYLVGVGVKDAPYFHESDVSLVEDD